MARARQEADWYRHAAMTANLLQPHSKTPVNILSLIPPAYRPRLTRPTASGSKETTRRVLDGLERLARKK